MEAMRPMYIRHRRTGRVGVIVGTADGVNIRVRYLDGKRDTWVYRVNLSPLWCICAQPLREGDIVEPCPVHGWSTR